MLITMLFSTLAFAQEAAPAAQPSFLEMALPFVLMIGIFYFLLIRPQMNKQKEHQKMLSELKKGQSVLTSGGLLGTIEALSDQFVTLEIAEGVKVKVLKGSISALPAKAEPKDAKLDTKKDVKKK